MHTSTSCKFSFNAGNRHLHQWLQEKHISWCIFRSTPTEMTVEHVFRSIMYAITTILRKVTTLDGTAKVTWFLDHLIKFNIISCIFVSQAFSVHFTPPHSWTYDCNLWGAEWTENPWLAKMYFLWRIAIWSASVIVHRALTIDYD